MDLPNQGIEPGSPALQADSLPTELSDNQKNMQNKFLKSVFINLSLGIYRENIKCINVYLTGRNYINIHSHSFILNEKTLYINQLQVDRKLK